MDEIGGTLREARMRARIDITEVERATKIRARYLRAIENEEWDALPGPVYVKSFLRTYGEYLGLDTRMLVDEYKRRYERPADGEVRSIAALHRERERAARGPLVPPWALIGVVLVGVVVALYVLGRNNSSNKPKPPVPTTTATRPARPAHRARPRHHAAATPPPAPRHDVTLTIVPTGRVYVCLVDGRGKKLVPGLIFDSGQSIPVHTAPVLLLTLGNASATLKANGKTVAVPPGSPTGLRVTPTGTTRLTRAQLPTCL